MDAERLYIHFVLISLLCFHWAISTSDPFDDDDEDGGPWSRCPWIRNALKHGRVKLRSRGRIAKFMCDLGYELAGKRFATCVRGQWNNPIPVCVSRGCSRPPDVSNGRVTEMYRGAMIMYDCLPGYTLQSTGTASTTLYCDGRHWSSKAPICAAATVNPMTFCDFEDKSLCGWSHDPNNDFDWKRNQMSTPSGHAGTGPSFDHTFGIGKSGFYLYLEASSPRKKGDKARLFSPVYSYRYSGGCFQFWYHMYGVNTGSLKVYIKPESQVFGELTPDWLAHGDQGNQWLSQKILVAQTEENFQIIFEGEEGDGYLGDIAIDDVNLVTNTCVSITNATVDAQDTVSSSCRGRCREAIESVSCSCTSDCISDENCCSDFMEICSKGDESGGTEISEEALFSSTTENSLLRSTPELDFVLSSSSSTSRTKLETDILTKPFKDLDKTSVSTGSPLTSFKKPSTITTDKMKYSTLLPLSVLLTSSTSSTSSNTFSAFSTTLHTASNTVSSTSNKVPFSLITVPSTSTKVLPTSTTSSLVPTTVPPSTLTTFPSSSTIKPSTSTSRSTIATILSKTSSKLSTTSTQALETFTTLSKTNDTTSAILQETMKLPMTSSTATPSKVNSASPVTFTPLSTITSYPALSKVSSVRYSVSPISNSVGSTSLFQGVSATSNAASTTLKPPTTSEIRRTYNLRPRNRTITGFVTPSPPKSTAETRRTYNLRPRNRITTGFVTPSTLKSTAPTLLRTTRLSHWLMSLSDITTKTKDRWYLDTSVPPDTKTTTTVKTLPSTIKSSTAWTRLFPTKTTTLFRTTSESTGKSSMQQHSKAASTASSDHQPIVTIVSLSVVLIMCLVGGLFFYMRKMKARKQSKLADDSEMRFLSENEVAEYSDPTALDRISFNPPSI